MENMNRRSLIKKLAIASGVVALAPVAQAALKCEEETTPKQTQGPFYPVADQIDKDTDLTVLKGSSLRALGRVIDVQGVVTDTLCQPVANAYVEIWQACASGKYNHPGDPNTAPLDPNFQYWGIAKTNAAGEYKFHTILPGAYPADTDWMRPPHIHFKVHKWGYQELITQLYFAGEALNEADQILQNLDQHEQEKVVRPIENETVTFNITLAKGNKK